MCIRDSLGRAQETGRTLEEYPNDVGCGLPGCNRITLQTEYSITVILHCFCASIFRSTRGVTGVLTVYVFRTSHRLVDFGGWWELRTHGGLFLHRFSPSTSKHQQVRRCGRFPRVGQDALSNGCPRPGDASRPRRGSFPLTSERT